VSQDTATNCKEQGEVSNSPPPQPTGSLLRWCCKREENMVVSLKKCCLAFCVCPLLAAGGVCNVTARKAEQGRDFFPSTISLGGLHAGKARASREYGTARGHSEVG